VAPPLARRDGELLCALRCGVDVADRVGVRFVADELVDDADALGLLEAPGGVELKRSLKSLPDVLAALSPPPRARVFTARRDGDFLTVSLAALLLAPADFRLDELLDLGLLAGAVGLAGRLCRPFDALLRSTLTDCRLLPRELFVVAFFSAFVDRRRVLLCVVSILCVVCVRVQ